MCSAADDVFVAGQGDEDIADFGSFGHGHDFKTVKDGFDGFNRVDFGDDDVSTEAFGTQRSLYRTNRNRRRRLSCRRRSGWSCA